MKVMLENDKVLIACQYQEKEIVKAIGDYQWLKRRNLWRFPQRKLIPIIERLNITYDGEIEALYQKLLEERKERENKLHWANLMKEGTAVDKTLNFNNLFSHQKTAFSVTNLFNSYALFMETGTGKTLVAIRLIQLRKVPTIVVAPLSTLCSVWEEEIAKWSNLKCINLWQNLDGIDKEADVYLVNYEHFKKLIRDPRLREKIKFLIIDESSKLKNNKTQITKAILAHNDIPYRLIMSGMPAPNSLLEYWGQMAFINPDLLGDNFWRYRNTYFMSVGYGGFMYVAYSGSREKIMSKVSEQSYFVKKEEAIDLPDKIYEKRYIEMDKLQKEKYEQMKKENILEFANKVSLAPNQLAKICKLREVTGGFIITTENVALKISDSKIKVLQEVLEEIDPKRQVIIWIQYHWECRELKKLFGERATVLYGPIPQKEKRRAIADFQQGRKQILIAHPKSGGMGLNLQNCSYVIWYSISYSLEEYSQACDRVFRLGQVNKVTYIHLLAKKTIDEVIFKALGKKQNMAEACLSMLKGGNNV